MKHNCDKRLDLFGMPIDNLSMTELLQTLTCGVVFTPNVDHVMKSQRDPEFRHCYFQADYFVCDSQILRRAASFLGKPIVEKISGSDLFPAFYEYHRHNPAVKIFLLGAAPGVGEVARDRINQKLDRDMVVATYAPPLGFEHDPEECARIFQYIRDSGANVLAVGFGAPKQERWIAAYHTELTRTVSIVLAIGATIDFEAGYRLRSPKWMSEVGLEWFYRLVQEPRRLWRRYLLDLMPFIGLVMREKFKLN